MLHQEQLLYYEDEYDALLATLESIGSSMKFPKKKFDMLRRSLETTPVSDIQTQVDVRKAGNI